MSDVTDLKAEVLLLRKENKQLRADQAHWELGNCPSCPNVVSLQEALEQNAKLRTLCEEMFAEHRRLYYSQGIMRGQSASSRQMARWHEEGMKLGLDVWGERKEVDG